MRILHFAQNVAGGISSYFDEIARHQLALYGASNVVFLIPRNDVANLSRVPLDCVRTFDHVERTVPSLSKLTLEVRRFVETFKPDIVHLHSSFAGLIFRAVAPTLRHRPKVVYCAHGWAFAREQSALATTAFARIEKLLMRLTDVCINISENEARLAVAHGIPAAKCITVQNGISALDDEPGAGPERGGDTIELLFVGRHDPQKGLDILLDAMRRVSNPKLRLKVAGASVVSKSAIDHGVIPDNVTLLGHVTRDEVGQLMRSCDALVVPSRWEGFGLVVVEAMRVHRPAIVSPNGALPDLVENGVTGLVAPELSAEGLAQVLNGLNRGDLDRMGERAEQRFRRNYTAERMNAAIDGIYDRLVPMKNRHDSVDNRYRPAVETTPS